MGDSTTHHSAPQARTRKIPPLAARRRGRLAAGVAAVASALLLVAAPGSADAATANKTGIRVDTLVQGAALPGADGLAVDRDGRLVVANRNSSRITTINPDNGRILSTLTATDGVSFPDDVVVGPDGTIYWTELTTGEVVRRVPGRRSQTIANVGRGVEPIAFAPDGRLFVARCLQGGPLYEIDPAGRQPVREAPGESSCAAAFGPDGRLYSSRTLDGTIVGIDVDSGQRQTVATGFSQDLFGGIGALDFAPDGTLYAVDDSRLLRVEVSTGTSTVVSDLGVELDGLVIDTRGRIFVSGRTDASVTEVRRNGSTRVVSRGGFVLPQGLALWPDQENPTALAVAAENGISRVHLATGRVLDFTSVRRPFVPFTVSSLSAGAGRWVTASPYGGMQLTVTPGEPVDNRGTGRLNFPVDGVFFGDGVLVAEGGTGDVLRFAGGTRSTALNFRGLAGLATDGDDVWGTDVRRGRIVQLIDDGTVLESPRVVARNLTRPQGLAAGHPGELVVYEAGAGKVTAVDLSTGRRNTLVTGLQPANPALPNLPTDGIYFGLTADSDGTVYVSDTFANRILRIKR